MKTFAAPILLARVARFVRARVATFGIVAATSSVSLFATRVSAAPAHPRSLRAAQSNKTIVVLDQLARDETQRREEIARLRADAERRERTDRMLVFATVAIAAGVLVVIRTRRSAAARRSRRAPTESAPARDPRDA